MSGAAREAAVKVTLSNGDVLAALRQLVQETERTGKAAQKHVGGGFAEAGREAKKSLHEIGNKAKEVLTLVGGLAGGFGFAEGIHGAVELRSKLTDLSVAIGMGTGQSIKWTQLHAEIADVAAHSGQSVDKLADAYTALYNEVGSVDFARESLQPIATLATATGKSVQQLSGVAGVLGEKFGIAGKEMPDALTKVIALASKGGVQFDDLQRVLSMTGASAKAAGLSGVEGLQRMIGMANVADDALGGTGKGIKVITSLMDQMASPEMQKKLLQTFHVNTRDAAGDVKDLGKTIEEVFAHGGTKREKLRAAFTDEQVKFLEGLAGPYRQTLDATSGDTKKAGSALQQALTGASEGGKTFADMQRLAAERMKDPAIQAQMALDHLKEAFTKPEMMAALDKLAALLPKLVDAMAPILGAAAEHPLAAAGVGVAGKMATDVGLGMAGKAISKKLAGTGLGALLGMGGEAAGAAVAGEGAVAAGGVAAAGGGIAATIGAVAAPVTAALLAGYGVYKGAQGISEYNAAEGDTRSMIDARKAGNFYSSSSNPEEKKQALARIDAQLAAFEARKKDRGVVADTIGGLSQMFGGTNAFESQENEAAKLRAAKKNLEASMASQPATPATGAQKQDTMKIAPSSTDHMAKSLAQHLAGMRLKVDVQTMPAGGGGAGSGTRGPARAPATTAGSEPR